MCDVVAVTQYCKLISFFIFYICCFVTKLANPNYSDKANKVIYEVMYNLMAVDQCSS